MNMKQWNEIINFTIGLLIIVLVISLCIWGVIDYTFEMGRAMGCKK